jgi:uncharacterized protein (DUF1330 family)
MTVYAIALLNITDPEGYKRYGQGFMDIFNRHGGQLLSVDDSATVIEGEDWPYTRAVLLSFPSAEALDVWYRSPEYQDLAQHRFKSSTAQIVVLRGIG